jgi:hypothetical protein
MPDTRGFEVVAQLDRSVLVQAEQGAWDNSVIPHSVPIAAGLAFGPYSVADGTVNIPRDQLDLELVPATNRVRAILGTNVQVEIANPPVPSARFFDMTTRTAIDLPVGTLAATVNVGILLSQVTRGDVAVTITSGDPVAPLTMGLIAEYVHARYVDATIPHSVTQTAVNLGGMTADAYLEIFDDASSGRAITVGPGSGPNTVKVVLPVRLRLSNISVSAARSPMAVDANIALTAPLVVAPGSVTARLSTATVAIENLAPAPGVEGQNYSLNLIGFPALANLLTTQLQQRGQAIVTAIGDIVVNVPTTAAIETFIGDRTFEALRTRGDIAIWTPQTEGTPVAVNDVQVKVLADAIAFGINAGNGANANAITRFIPAGMSCAVAIDGDKVIALIQEAIHRPESEGGFGAGFPPKTFDNIEGRRVRLNSLDPSLINGFIQLRGNVTVFNAIAGSIDADADFTAKLVLEWIDNPNGSQSLKASLSGDPDVDLGIGAWILGLILGFVTFGAVGVVVIVVVLSLADDLAESIGGDVIRDEVTGRVETLTAWPPALQGIGSVVSRFENPVTIDPQSVMFPDEYVVHATFESTVDALAESNGPYLLDAGAPVLFVGGPARPDTDYLWEFGDGGTAASMTATHVYGDNGLYVATLTTTVNQPGGVVTRHFAAIRARNVPPFVDAGNVITIDEGQEVEFVASFTDPEWLDTHEATFFFGDDSLPVAGSVEETNDPPRAVGTVRARHAYCDNGEYQLEVQVRDDDGGVGSDTRTVVVRNVPPTVDAGDDLYVLPGTAITVRACFRDPGWCDTHTATWDPGDCTPIRTAVVRERHNPPAGIGTVSALHRYEQCGTYLATCTVTDDDGGIGTDTVVVRVADLENRDFEGGFRVRREGLVANHWTPYGKAAAGRDAGGPYRAEEFVVHGGQRAQGIVLGQGGRLGIRQSLGANVGWDYQVAAWFQLPPGPHEAVARLGIDPAGGDDPAGPAVLWCTRGAADAWSQLAERVTATASAITVFLEVEASAGPARIAFDDVEILAEACQVADCVPPEQPPDKHRCVDFGPQEAGRLEPRVEIDGFAFESRDGQPLVIEGIGQPPEGALRIPAKGLQVGLPFTSARVEAEVLGRGGEPVRLVAIGEGGQVVAQRTAAPGRDRMVVEAAAITWVVLSEGSNEALLLELCVEHGSGRHEGDDSGTARARGSRVRKGR